MTSFSLGVGGRKRLGLGQQTEKGLKVVPWLRNPWPHTYSQLWEHEKGRSLCCLVLVWWLTSLLPCTRVGEAEWLLEPGQVLPQSLLWVCTALGTTEVLICHRLHGSYGLRAFTAAFDLISWLWLGVEKALSLAVAGSEKPKAVGRVNGCIHLFNHLATPLINLLNWVFFSSSTC